MSDTRHGIEIQVGGLDAQGLAQFTNTIKELTKAVGTLQSALTQAVSHIGQGGGGGGHAPTAPPPPATAGSAPQSMPTAGQTSGGGTAPVHQPAAPPSAPPPPPVTHAPGATAQPQPGPTPVNVVNPPPPSGVGGGAAPQPAAVNTSAAGATGRPQNANVPSTSISQDLYSAFDNVGSQRDSWAYAKAAFTQGASPRDVLERWALKPVPGNKHGLTYQDVYLNDKGVAKSAFSIQDSVLGDMHIPEGASMAQVALHHERMQTAQLAQRAAMLGRGAAATFLSPTVAPESAAMTGAGSALMMSANPYAALGGAALLVGGGINADTKGQLHALGNQYAPLERPREQLAHMGIAKGDMLSMSAKGARYGYGQAEALYKESEHMAAMGMRMDMAQYGRMFSPFEAELRHLSPGTTAYFQSAGRPGGGMAGGSDSSDAALRHAMTSASAMGLEGNSASAYLSRIASTLQGMAERGLMARGGAGGGVAADTLARRWASEGLAAAGGNKDLAYMQGERGASLGANFQSFAAEAGQNLSMAGQFRQLGEGAMRVAAIRRLREQGKDVSWINTQVEMDNLAESRDAGYTEMMKAFGGSASREVKFGLFRGTTRASAKEALAHVDQGGSALSRFYNHALGKSSDNVDAGSQQDLMKSRAAAELQLVATLGVLSGDIKTLISTLSAQQRASVSVGATLTRSGEGSLAADAPGWPMM